MNKKYLKYILPVSIFMAQNLFAQSTTDTEGMDMAVYATWMVTVFFVVTFIMAGVFLYSVCKEPANPENVAIQTAGALVKTNIIKASGNSLYLLPSLSLELSRIRVLLISALITFSLILILLII